MLDPKQYEDNYLSQLSQAAKRYGAKKAVAGDILTPEINYKQLLLRSLILSGALEKSLEGQRFVGVLLPNTLGIILTFTGLHMLDKIPCMLNYTAGEANILHACQIATVQTVLTSRAFVEKASLESIVAALSAKYQIIYLEDVRQSVGISAKLRGLGRYVLGDYRCNAKPDDPAVVLYTSGSEGVPKGVALSHRNILANVAQACAHLDLHTTDRLFNALPVFHSFGLTVGVILPLLRGMFTFLYPSPLHYKIIPKMVRDTGATIMVGTDTFFNGYVHYSEPDYYTKLRFAVAGAEKLRERTREFWQTEYGVTILQGYGVTETSPVLSVNTPSDHKFGTVGRVLPEVECKVIAVEGLERGGELLVKGPNVMLGYIKAEKPGVIQPQGEWYATGDIVEIDAKGYITILGRAKRFAKIAGEMVSLLAVEEFVAGVSPEKTHAALAIPDERKGEQVVLFTEDEGLTRAQLIEHAKQAKIPELFLPKHLHVIQEIPRLGNGKIDYPSLKKLL